MCESDVRGGGGVTRANVQRACATHLCSSSARDVRSSSRPAALCATACATRGAHVKIVKSSQVRWSQVKQYSVPQRAQHVARSQVKSSKSITIWHARPMLT